MLLSTGQIIVARDRPDPDFVNSFSNCFQAPKMPPSVENEVSELSHIEDEYVAEGPMALFNRWKNAAAAAKVVKPETGSLSTCTKDGCVSNRNVCWRLTDQGRFVFLTDSRSKKCRELEDNRRAAVAFLWIHPNKQGLKLARQVRLEGQLNPVDRETVVKIFDMMLPHFSLRAHLCTQGEEVDIDELRDRYNQLKSRQNEGEKFVTPEHVVGYELVPDKMEFYEDEAFKVGDRVLFTRETPEDGICSKQSLKPNLWNSFHISA